MLPEWNNVNTDDFIKNRVNSKEQNRTQNDKTLVPDDLLKDLGQTSTVDYPRTAANLLSE